MASERFGILYVATRRPHYVAEAFLSAHSVRDLVPDLPITLFTDQPDLPFAAGNCFDEVVSLEPGPGTADSPAEGRLDRIRALRHMPYERTLYLDADTRVFSPAIAQLQGILDRADMAFTPCQLDGLEAGLAGVQLCDTGVLLMRRSPAVLALLGEWEARARRQLHLAAGAEVPQLDGLPPIALPEVRRKLLLISQTSLAPLLSPHAGRPGLVHLVLDPGWNCRSGASAAPVHIAHDPALRARLGQDIIARAERYWREGNPDQAMALLQCLHDALLVPEDHAGRASVRSLMARAFPVTAGALSADEIRELVERDDPVILEIGANCGQTTVELLQAMPRARIFAFEPDPRAIAKFRHNVRHPGVELYECAVGAANGTTTFHQSSGGEHDAEYREGWDQSGSIRQPRSHLQVYPWVKFEKQIEVPITRLDDWASAHGVARVDFIWADVQGAESDLIDGAERVLAHASFFYTEYSNHELYEGQVTLPGLVEKLPDFDLVRRYPMDVLFRRRPAH